MLYQIPKAFEHYRVSEVYRPDEPETDLLVYIPIQVIEINLCASPMANIVRVVFSDDAGPEPRKKLADRLFGKD